jgi:hypothetical protein
MAGHRRPPLGRQSSCSRSRGLPARSTPSRSMAGDACAEIGGIRLVRLGPGDPLTSPGMDLLSKIRTPSPSRRHRFVSDTPAASTVLAVRAGMGGRGLSHPQEEPLTGTGAAELRARPGACGQPGSRTADRMAVPLSPSIRERACPARLRPARISERIGKENRSWMCTAESTGPKMCDTRWHVASELADRRAGVMPVT